MSRVLCSKVPLHHWRNFVVQSSVVSRNRNASLLEGHGAYQGHSLYSTFSKAAASSVCVNRVEQRIFGVRPMEVIARGYAKGKSKGKDKAKKGGSGKVMKLSPEEIDTVIDSLKFHQQLEGQVQHLRNEFTQQLSLRTSLGSFDNLIIETSDGKFPLMQLGQVAQKTQQTVVINMSGSPQHIPKVKTALMTLMSLNAQQDGTSLFVNIPKITKEHRESLAKSAKSLAEKTKLKLRDVQNKYLQNIKKTKDQFSEDLVFSVQHYVQDEVKSYSEKIDTLTAAKQKELMGGK